MLDLIQAVQEGNLEAITNLLNQGYNIEERNNKDQTALILAAKITPPDDPYINLLDDDAINDQETAKHINDAIIKLLIERGADVKARDQGYNTALTWASKTQKLEAIKLLIKSNAHFHTADRIYRDKALISAAERNNIEAMELLIKHNADVNVVGNDKTPLMWAAECNNIEAMELLIKHGAHVNVVDNGKTALMWAAECNNIEAMELLIKHNADIDAKNQYHETALMLAAKRNNIEAMELLIKHNADIDAKNQYHETALIWASKIQKLEVMELLIKHNADIDAKNQYHETALIWTVTHNNIKDTELLIKAGADLSIKDYYGNTALMIAESNFLTEAADLLKLASKVDQLIAGKEIEPLDASQEDLFLEFFCARATSKGISSYDDLITIANNVIQNHAHNAKASEEKTAIPLPSKLATSIRDLIIEHQEDFAEIEDAIRTTTEGIPSVIKLLPTLFSSKLATSIRDLIIKHQEGFADVEDAIRTATEGLPPVVKPLSTLIKEIQEGTSDLTGSEEPISSLDEAKNVLWKIMKEMYQEAEYAKIEAYYSNHPNEFTTPGTYLKRLDVTNRLETDTDKITTSDVESNLKFTQMLTEKPWVFAHVDSRKAIVPSSFKSLLDSFSKNINDALDKADAEAAEMLLLQSTQETEEDFSDLPDLEEFTATSEVVALGDTETSDASL